MILSAIASIALAVLLVTVGSQGVSTLIDGASFAAVLAGGLLVAVLWGGVRGGKKKRSFEARLSRGMIFSGLTMTLIGVGTMLLSGTPDMWWIGMTGVFYAAFLNFILMLIVESKESFRGKVWQF